MVETMKMWNPSRRRLDDDLDAGTRDSFHLALDRHRQLTYGFAVLSMMNCTHAV